MLNGTPTVRIYDPSEASWLAYMANNLEETFPEMSLPRPPYTEADIIPEGVIGLVCVVCEVNGEIVGFGSGYYTPDQSCEVFFITPRADLPSEDRSLISYTIFRDLGVRARDMDIPLICGYIKDNPISRSLCSPWITGDEEVSLFEGVELLWLKQPTETFIADCEARL